MLNANFSRYNEISFKLSQINHAIESKRSTYLVVDIEEELVQLWQLVLLLQRHFGCQKQSP